MTKQTVELVYHDAEEKPEELDYHQSHTVLGYHEGTWIPVYYDFHRGCWVSLASGNSINHTVWIDMPPKPKKKVWVKKELRPDLVSHIGQGLWQAVTWVPPDCRNIVCTYEIEEEQP